MKKLSLFLIVLFISLFSYSQEYLGLTKPEAVKAINSEKTYKDLIVKKNYNNLYVLTWKGMYDNINTTLYFDTTNTSYLMTVVCENKIQVDALKTYYTWIFTKVSESQWTYIKNGKTVYIDYKFVDGGEPTFTFHY